jgi:hypothetical protein
VVAALRKGRDADVVLITSAPESVDSDIAQRQRRYVISMLFRTVCFVAAILVGGGWLRWVLIAAAFLLPYFAVVVANSASPRVEGTAPEGPGLSGIDHPELPPRG